MKKVAIFFDGTWANKNPQYRPIVTQTNSLVAQLHEECSADYTHYFAGPGTSSNGYLSNWLGGIAGDISETGVEKNVRAAFLQIRKALNSETEIELEMVGWSRGGVSNFRLLNKLNEELTDEEKEKIKEIRVYSIDPVPGGPMDRGKKILDLNNLSDNSEFLKKTTSVTFYSACGGLNSTNIMMMKRAPFFSALLDPFIGNENSAVFAFPVNHEKIAGIGDDEYSKQIKSRIKVDSACYSFESAGIEHVDIDERPDDFKERGFLSPSPGFNHSRQIYLAGGQHLEGEMLQFVGSPADCQKETQVIALLKRNKHFSKEKLEFLKMKGGMVSFYDQHCSDLREKSPEDQKTFLDNYFSKKQELKWEHIVLDKIMQSFIKRATEKGPQLSKKDYVKYMKFNKLKENSNLTIDDIRTVASLRTGRQSYGIGSLFLRATTSERELNGYRNPALSH